MKPASSLRPNARGVVWVYEPASLVTMRIITTESGGALPTVELHPCLRQFILGQGWYLLLCAASLGVAAFCTFPNHRLAVLASPLLFPLLLWQLLRFSRIVYILTPEQLVYCHGVCLHKTDYMELYRVVDYQQRMTPAQQLFGVKSVVIYSCDRNMPVLLLTGIPSHIDIVSEIRYRVEYNKRRKGIYEITNR